MLFDKSCARQEEPEDSDVDFLGRQVGVVSIGLLRRASRFAHQMLSTILKVIHTFKFNLLGSVPLVALRSDLSVWRGGDWVGFVRIVLAGILATAASARLG